MYLYKYICIYTCIYIHIYIYTHTYTYIHILKIYAYVYIHTCIELCTHYIPIYIYIYIYIHMYAHMYVQREVVNALRSRPTNGPSPQGPPPPCRVTSPLRSKPAIIAVWQVSAAGAAKMLFEIKDGLYYKASRRGPVCNFQCYGPLFLIQL